MEDQAPYNTKHHNSSQIEKKVRLHISVSSELAKKIEEFIPSRKRSQWFEEVLKREFEKFKS